MSVKDHTKIVARALCFHKVALQGNPLSGKIERSFWPPSRANQGGDVDTLVRVKGGKTTAGKKGVAYAVRRDARPGRRCTAADAEPA